MEDLTNTTGPWGLTDLQTKLGAAKNHGEITTQSYLGGGSERFQANGPYSFSCGCVAVLGGISGDLYLRPCTAEHAALTPVWTT